MAKLPRKRKTHGNDLSVPATAGPAVAASAAATLTAVAVTAAQADAPLLSPSSVNNCVNLYLILYRRVQVRLVPILAGAVCYIFI